jgi:quinol monooxygenase YgiN
VFGVYTKITTNSGKRQQLLNILLLAAKEMEIIDACKLYLVNESATEEETIWITEVWDDKEHHIASLSLEKVKNLFLKQCP